MNQPARSWLLKKHAEAQPRLDALRHHSLPAPTNTETTFSPALSGPAFLRELFYPTRHLWYAFATVWLLLLLIQLGLPRTPQSATQDKAASRHLSNSIAQLHALLNETSSHP